MNPQVGPIECRVCLLDVADQFGEDFTVTGHRTGGVVEGNLEALDIVDDLDWKIDGCIVLVLHFGSLDIVPQI